MSRNVSRNESSLQPLGLGHPLGDSGTPRRTTRPAPTGQTHPRGPIHLAEAFRSRCATSVFARREDEVHGLSASSGRHDLQRHPLRKQEDIVSWFSFRRKGLSDDQLRTALFDFVASGDTRNVESLVSRHRERVAALFPSWTTVPLEVRADPLRTKWWAGGALGVAKIAAQLGDESLMAQLLGREDDNILITWQSALRSAQAEATRDRYASAIHILEDILERTKGLTGTGVDDLLPKSYGLLGTAYWRAGNRDIGRTYLVKAREYCERIGNDDGAKTYSTNLRTIDAAGQKRTEHLERLC